MKGTFDDLSDDEKTKAFLQLLEYKLRLEAEQQEAGQQRDEDSFHELWQRLPAHQVRACSECLQRFHNHGEGQFAWFKAPLNRQEHMVCRHDLKHIDSNQLEKLEAAKAA